MLKNIKGYTLMEIVVVMFAMSLITTAIAPFIRLNVKSYLNVRKTKYGVQTARIGFNKMLSEVRLFVNTNTLVRTSGSRLGFNLPNGDYIEYVYSSDDEGIGVTDTWVSVFRTPECDPFMGGVEDFNIDYFDKNGNLTSSRQSMHRIRISMKIKDPDYEERKISLIGQVCIDRFF